MSIFTLAFAKAALERAVKTFAQAAVAVLTAGATGLLDVNWTETASIAGLAALVSVLTSVGSGAVTKHGPSLANEVTAPDLYAREYDDTQPLPNPRDPYGDA